MHSTVAAHQVEIAVEVPGPAAAGGRARVAFAVASEDQELIRWYLEDYPEGPGRRGGPDDGRPGRPAAQRAGRAAVPGGVRARPASPRAVGGGAAGAGGHPGGDRDRRGRGDRRSRGSCCATRAAASPWPWGPPRWSGRTRRPRSAPQLPGPTRSAAAGAAGDQPPVCHRRGVPVGGPPARPAARPRRRSAARRAAPAGRSPS